MKRVVFLDRDGVINEDKAYVHQWEDFKFVPGAVDAMRRLIERGFGLVIITNQSGIAHGLFSEQQYFELREAVRLYLIKNGIELLGIYHCPHHPLGTVSRYAVECSCKKTAPGLILQAANDFGINLSSSILVGDKSSDIEAARSAGVGAAYIVKSNNPENDLSSSRADGVFNDLAACVEYIFHG